MKINELLQGFTIYKTIEEEKLLEKLQSPIYLSTFNEHDKFVIEGMVRKSLVIKIGQNNPRVVANEF